ncbi:MAG: ABC transporter permease subunit [Thermodesulfobacteriota bacterium]
MDRRFIQKVRRRDRIATRVITVGGMLVIASVIAILLIIVKVALPLFMPAQAETARTLAASTVQPPLAVGVDDERELAFALDQQGRFSFYELASGAVVSSLAASDTPRAIRSIERHDDSFTILWQDGGATLCRVAFNLVYGGNGERSVVPELDGRRELPPETLPAAPLRVAARTTDDSLTRVSLLADNRFSVTRQTTSRDLFGNETTETATFLIAEEMPGNITAFTLNRQGDILYAGTDSGSLLRWEFNEEAATRTDNVVAVSGNQAVTALALVFGDISVAVGGADGSLATWMPVIQEQGGDSASRKLRRIHTLAAHAAPVTAILPSRRTKSLVSLSQNGRVHFDHMTSSNHLLAIDAKDLAVIGLAGQDNSLIAGSRQGEMRLWKIDIPHPEVNLKTLFGKVWYESYPAPDFVWQSSAANDDFEPKLSIVPLLFGTIKGTLYAMIFALPLAIFGAVYTSQFAPPAFRNTIKPAIEIMASVPSVVIGFLIALWLAPLVEQGIMALLLALIALPLFFIFFMLLIRPLCERPTIQHRMKGYEFLLLLPVILLAAAFCLVAAPWFENLLFQGDFRQWLFDAAGMRYDQRNSIIIAFGLGIAVIPIIFSITEDAITNIPPSLTAASLALGASRWQTIWRVVLPSASPGIFAAIMIGFGRAVGETMIVLMATGNTPIMDWSVFNGMRTLSANIAVEIPEAPQGGTLYRVLFLCATLLFLMTFVLNTGAEIIRERLRKKYGRY